MILNLPSLMSNWGPWAIDREIASKGCLLVGTGTQGGRGGRRGDAGVRSKHVGKSMPCSGRHTRLHCVGMAPK